MLLFCLNLIVPDLDSVSHFLCTKIEIRIRNREMSNLGGKVLGADVSVVLGLLDPVPLLQGHRGPEPQLAQGRQHMLDAPEGQDSLSTPGK